MQVTQFGHAAADSEQYETRYARYISTTLKERTLAIVRRVANHGRLGLHATACVSHQLALELFIAAQIRAE